MIQVTNTIALNEDEIDEDFVRASGPGGQNVNKVATAVQLRFDALHSPSLPAEVRDRLLRLGGKRITEDGVVIIDARRFRTQERNRQDALDRLIALIRRAAVRPRSRRKTKPTRTSIEQRIDTKKRRGQTKQMRRHINEDKP